LDILSLLLVVSFSMGWPPDTLTGAIESRTSRGMVRCVLRVHIDVSFRALFRIVLTVGLPISLSSLPGVERPMTSVICFISSILRKSDLGYFLS